jgi:hypothetical protein
LNNSVRYVIYSDLLPGGRWRLFFNVSDDTFCDQLDTATLFKREHVALAVAKLCSDGRKRDLFVAKITTKDRKRRVLKHEKQEHRTKPPSRFGIAAPLRSAATRKRLKDSVPMDT